MATKREWELVLTDLTEVALKVKDVPNAKATYNKYLEQLGYSMQEQPRKKDNTKYTAEEVVKHSKHLGGIKMNLKQLERLLAGEKVGIKNGRISLEGDWFVVEEKVEENFITIDGFKNLELALKRLGGE